MQGIWAKYDDSTNKDVIHTTSLRWQEKKKKKMMMMKTTTTTPACPRSSPHLVQQRVDVGENGIRCLQPLLGVALLVAGHGDIIFIQALQKCPAHPLLAVLGLFLFSFLTLGCFFRRRHSCWWRRRRRRRRRRRTTSTSTSSSASAWAKLEQDWPQTRLVGKHLASKNSGRGDSKGGGGGVQQRK